MLAKSTIVLDDVFYHLNNLKTDYTKLKIEFNKDQYLVHAMNKLVQEIELIELIIKSYDNYNLKVLTNEINIALLSDPELHCVNIIVKKKAFLDHLDKSKTALITHEI